ncbi:MAG: MFS transporter [Desulfobacterales bacterium]
MKSVKFILGAQYFLYFGILGLFLPFFNLYCYPLGVSGFEIGVLSSAKTLTTALFPMIWAAFADRFHIRRPIYIFCNFASTAFWALFLLTTDFWLMLAITAFYGFFTRPSSLFWNHFPWIFWQKKKPGTAGYGPGDH